MAHSAKASTPAHAMWYWWPPRWVLTPRPERLLKPGGFDAYFAQVLAALRVLRSAIVWPCRATLGNLILACHSGGGWPMRQLAGGQDRVLARIRECWGFDCTYNRGDDAFWAGMGAGSTKRQGLHLLHCRIANRAALA